MPVDIYAKSPSDYLEPEEVRLFNLINQYRQTKNLPIVAASKALTIVANRHVRDVAENLKLTVADRDKSGHSWSWGAFESSNPTSWPNMWDAPQRLKTGYPGKGYENFYMTTAKVATPEMALKGWQNSLLHRQVILNEWIWEKISWNALGVALYKGYASMWFGAEVDPTGKPQIRSSAVPAFSFDENPQPWDETVLNNQPYTIMLDMVNQEVKGKTADESFVMPLSILPLSF